MSKAYLTVIYVTPCIRLFYIMRLYGTLLNGSTSAIVSKIKINRLKDREVFVCNFSKLQFPNAEGTRSLSHVPVR